MCFSTVFHAKS
jgi:hypothetical protein